MPHAFMIRKKCFNLVGSFYEKYLIIYEESELAIRINKLRFKVLAVPNAIVYHNIPLETDNERNLGLHQKDRVYLLARNRYIFMKRNASKIGFALFLLIFQTIITIHYLLVLLRIGKYNFINDYLKGIFDGLKEN